MESSSTRDWAAVSRRWLKIVVIVLWGIALIAIFVRVAYSPHRNTVLDTYETAGRRWLEARDIYKTHRGFVYSPLIAAFFAPFSLLPDLLSNVLWRLLNVTVYLSAVYLWLKLALHHCIPKSHHVLVLLLLLPLSIGNLNNGQANPIIVGLLMLAVIGTSTDRWCLSAFCVALAAYFKIYPLVIGMLLTLVFPRKLSWRLLVALIVLGGISYLLQKPDYVTHQYELWIATRISDNRRLNVPVIAPNDLWLLLRCLHISISERIYMVLQALSGAAIAAICLFGRLKEWPLNRLLVALFTLGVCWMLLLGPATESATYILLAPVLVLALVQAFNQPMSPWLRAMPVSTYLILLVSLGINSFTPFKKDIHAMSLQPASALIFSCYAVIWILTPYYWPASTEQPSSTTQPNELSQRS